MDLARIPRYSVRCVSCGVIPITGAVIRVATYNTILPILATFHCARQVDHEKLLCVDPYRAYHTSSLSLLQGTIPKKPYNPILGEIFRCYWDLPDCNRVAPTAEAKVLVIISVIPVIISVISESYH